MEQTVCSEQKMQLLRLFPLGQNPLPLQFLKMRFSKVKQ